MTENAYDSLKSDIISNNRKDANYYFMNLDKKTRRYLIQIIAFAIIFFCALQNLPAVGSALRYILNLFLPFFLGLAIAFIFHVPMRGIEKHLFR